MRSLLTAAVLFMVILVSSTAAAKEDEFWYAKYWNNTVIGGKVVLERYESEINYDWGRGSPASAVNSNYFSAEWKRRVSLPAGTYRFTATMDDGMRVWVAGQKIIDSWYDSQVHTVIADIQLGDGDHDLLVKYYEAGGDAVARLSWTRLPTPVPEAINHWQGEYFNNPYLADVPAIVRDDPDINFDWGLNSPVPGVVQENRFSIRWTRNVHLNPGRYRFTTTSDDGVRLWVNNVLLIDQWRDQAEISYSADMELPGGQIPIKMEYYDNYDFAVARLGWTRVSDGGPIGLGSWRGEYFSNRDLSGSPALVRHDASINFDWGCASPAPQIPADNFSVRWTRDIELRPGRYLFATTTDDGVRLWVNNRLLIDQWSDHPATTYTGEIDLPGGAATITMEYYEHMGLAEAHLSVSPG